MRTMIETVLRPLAVAVLAGVVANCNEGCLPFMGDSISPSEAYAMEMSGCTGKRNAEVRRCAEKSPTLQDSKACRADAEEAYRVCVGQVERKYLNYNGNGSYPSSSGQ